eukprot:c14254_g1_i1.p1 GENE.c14254_g1_i1~~c14254_g1_i1.p1  ORF type:complete len:313 (+),score=141.70 c14254_g1_i1:35-973(+)
MENLWNTPLVSGIAFQVQQSTKETNIPENFLDGEFNLSDGEKIAFRLAKPQGETKAKVVVIHFHANAELITDVNFDGYLTSGYAVLSLGYRGYAWGTGSPTIGTLFSDANECFKQFEDKLNQFGLNDIPWIIQGRSLGATCASYLASEYPSKFIGIIFESGLVDIKSIPMVYDLAKSFMPQVAAAWDSVPDPLRILEKISKISAPLLIIHGRLDELIPFNQAEKCLSTATTKTKRLHEVKEAGHNDVRFLMGNGYYQLISSFVDHICLLKLSPEDVDKMGISQLKSALKARGIDSSQCVEKSELVSLLKSSI